jgi:hypothetical protein
VAAAAPASAQFAQYVSPGTLALAPLSTRERLEAAVGEARYHLGPVAWSPYFAIKDVNYFRGTELAPGTDEGNFTATAAAGVHACLSARQTLYLAAHAIPEATWWHGGERRTVRNWSYGVGVFAFSNKLTLELALIDSRHQEFLSSAVQELVNTGKREARADVELPLFGQIALYGTASTTDWRYRRDDLPGEEGQLLVGLDRTEERVGGGLRWHVREGLRVGAGLENVAVEFLRRERDRSSSGTAPVLDLEWEGGTLALRTHFAWVSLEPEAGSAAVPFEDVLGTAQLRYAPTGRSALVLYGGRSIAFSYLDQSPYFVEQRRGIALEREVGWRSGVHVYLERGVQDYVATLDTPGHTEDTRAVGAMITVQLHRRLTVALGGVRTEYDAERAGAGRSLTRFQVALRSGDPRAQWW